MQGNFACFFCRLLFFKIIFFQRVLTAYFQNFQYRLLLKKSSASETDSLDTNWTAPHGAVLSVFKLLAYKLKNPLFKRNLAADDNSRYSIFEANFVWQSQN